MTTDLFLSAVEELAPLPKCLERLRVLALELALQGFFSGDVEPDSSAPGWHDVAISDFAEVQAGNSIAASTKALKFEGLRDGYPYIATKDVDGRSGAINYANGVRIPFDQEGFRVAPAGSVLVCAEGGSAGKKVGLLDRAVCYGNKLFAVTPKPSVEPGFVLRLLQGRTFQEKFAQEKTGIIGGVALKRFKAIRLALPPQKMQQQILEILAAVYGAFDEAEKARDALATSVKEARDALTSKMQESTSPTDVEHLLTEFKGLFESQEAIASLRQLIIDLAANGSLDQGATLQPKVLSDLISFGPKNGYSPKPVTQITATKTMSLSAVTSGTFDPSAFKYVDEEIAPESDLWVKPGDILIQRANTIEYVGVSARYTGREREFIYPDLMMRITPSSNVDGEFLHLALLSSPARKFMRERASGTSGTMPKVNQATVKGVPIWTPSLEAQYASAETARALLGQCADLANALESREKNAHAFIDALFASLGDGSPIPPENSSHPSYDIQSSDAPATDKGERQVETAPIEGRSTEVSPYLDDRLEEAQLVSAVVRAFFDAGSEPIGNFRLQKAVYFARRWLGDGAVRADYLKKAAGPYNPQMRYSGGIAIAKQLGWIREAKGRFGFGHVPGAERPTGTSYERAATWVRDTLKLRKNDDWESLATIDYAALALDETGQSVEPARVIAYVESDAEWRPKVARLMLDEFKVQSYLNELLALFPARN